MKATLISCLLLFSGLAIASEPFYHAVKAEKGDGIFSLLRRYHLDYHPCNRQHFLELNNLSINDHLRADTKYKLPVMIYRYNGKSIRSTVGIDNWDQAIRIKEYNEKILKDKLRKTNYLHSNILWVPYNELHCKDYTVKSASSPIISTDIDEGKVKSVEMIKETPLANTSVILKQPLFGSKYNEVAVLDNSLKGKVYYIVSGHGGPDPGARCTQCINTLCEDEYAYDVSLRLVRQLMRRGATVHMIIQDKNDGIRDDAYLDCDIDETCLGERIPLNQKKRLQQRAEAINDLYREYKRKGVTDQTAIVIHVDSNSEHTSQDVYFYHHKSSKSSKKLAQSLQKTFKAKYDEHQKGRGYKGFVRGRGLYMLNNTLPTCAYIELANIRNKSDHRRLILNDNREALAKWLYEGLLDYGN